MINIKEEDLGSFQTQSKKKIAVIYPPYGSIDNEPGLKVVKDNYGVFPSLSLLYVAGCAKGAGHEVLFLDVNATQISKDEVLSQIKSFQPDYIFYTITTYQLKENLDWIVELKKSYDCPVVVGGVHMGIYPEETMRHTAIDVGFIGECDFSLPAFLECDVLDYEAFSKVRGIIYRKEEQTYRTRTSPVLMNVDNAHFPARELIDNSLYSSFITQYKNFTPFISSRGCPFKCIFCEQGEQKFRGRSAKNIMQEIQIAYEQHGVREFDFFDSSFTIQKDRVIKICQAIIASGLKIHWSVRSRVDCINEEVLHWLAKANCTRIYYGIESGNACILKTLKKNANLEEMRETIRLTKKIGISAFGYFMIGSPGETRDTVRETIDFSKTLDLDYAQFSKVTPMPATQLYALYLKEFQHDYWREFVKNPSHQIAIQRPGCTMPDEEIQAYCKQAYLEFYYRPDYIFKALLRVKSFPELFRSVKVAFQMRTSG
ncbi:B12-binding domain-containing radical SAM protein [bacterium]|nr:B12-binding domain-containing radical SAM protein [bacterium]